MERQQEIISRNEYIKNLNTFLVTAKNILGDTLCKLNWNESDTIVKSTAKPLVACPLDEGHRVPPGNVEKHLELCKWHRQGYRDDDVPLPSPPARLPISSVVIDKTTQRDVILRAAQNDPSLKIGENVMDREVPQTSDRLCSDFTTDERRVLYDYAVSRTAGTVPQLKEFNLTMKPEGQSTPMTREQLMAAERDAKRRRVKHRTAKVHTKSKNYSEVLRQVINNQMLAYEDWIRDNFGDSDVPEADKPEKNSEELKQEKQEMVWLDWDFRGNPHTRWKYILEKEKRRKEREEKDNRGDKDSKKDYERRRDREESNSRKYHRVESRKRDYDDERRGKHRHHDSDREDRRGRDDDRHRRRDKNYDMPYRDKIRNESTSRDSNFSRYKGTSEEKKDEKYRRDSWDKSKYTKSECRERFKQEDDYRYEPIEKHSGKGSGNHKDKSIDSRISTQNDKYGGRLEQDERSKEIKSEDNGEYVNTSYESELVKKETFAESTDSDSSSDSSSSSSSRRDKKRKKSKKKHKHKHKKKHRKH
ncbi:U11/U12 small nuclear ribonucleoprotein 48 kDa protein-like [Macrosteles quadrilineatus]|uniref:U11/U12 small nuclear ribonucleoprotein 48 kDa protein-like n=1 Tax=Macrosteles quadrilineatus TaxID=74068 RepID=UPI0023E2A2DC|nr:U11/U12 small nuclear ribonucleoprotein 48 kDa protein-like [Macrosteles quadrilineatus]